MAQRPADQSWNRLSDAAPACRKLCAAPLRAPLAVDWQPAHALCRGRQGEPPCYGQTQLRSRAPEYGEIRAYIETRWLASHGSLPVAWRRSGSATVIKRYTLNRPLTRGNRSSHRLRILPRNLMSVPGTPVRHHRSRDGRCAASLIKSRAFRRPVRRPRRVATEA